MLSQEKNLIKDHVHTNSKTNHMSEGQYKISCSVCQDQRKNKLDTPLSVNINNESIIYHCHHCGINGAISRSQGIKMNRIPSPTKQQPKKIIKFPTPDKGEAQKWLEQRGISIVTAEKSGCILGTKNNKPVIGFPFTENNETVAVKYRTASSKKEFWWENNATRLWGGRIIDKSLPTMADTIVITEGEIDTLSITEAFQGLQNVIVYSVPNGAPNKVTENLKVDPKEDGRFKYIWEDRNIFDKVTRIILAVDVDANGKILADELSRRLDKARCYNVDWGEGFKDANELLVARGSEAVRQSILSATPVPLHGLHNIDYYSDDFQKLYERGKPQGVSTGYDSVDQLFNLQTGNLCVVTGYPGDGKSAFIDQILINVAKNYGWKANICSFEKPPTYHAIQLAQCYIGKPFFEGNNQRMSQDEKDISQQFISEHFLFQDYQDGGSPTIEAILSRSAQAVMRYGCKILVIDPYNFIESNHKGLETDAISAMLTKIQLHCKKYDVLCFFIAHPNKPQMRDGKKNLVTGVDISGSMAFFSKSDMGLTVYRGEDSVGVHCWKQRWTWMGKTGNCKLTFNPLNNRYAEAEKVEDNYDWEF